METNPEGTAQTYIFLVDNQDIALNIVMSGYQALCLVQEDDGYYFSADSFIEEMRSIQFTGSCQSAYHYVASCTVKWVNDKILTFFKDAGLDGKAGWQLFKEKEYLGKLDNQKEVEKLLEQYILRFEREPKEQPELSRFHLFDAKGNVKGVRDMEIVDYLVENVQFFVVGITPYYYEHGAYWEDHNGVRMKHRQGRGKPGCVPVGQWDIPQEEPKRGDLEPQPVGGGILSDPGGVGRFPLNLEAVGLQSGEEGREPVGADHLPGAAGVRNGGAESGLGGMAHGLPERMDGRILWAAEPEGIPRMTERMDDRALRLKTLGKDRKSVV